ncbi:MAG TPA: hypothetical protein VGH14_12715 [Solirubrobacterales bacterium]|jgi:uncharacterized membrane-anchored protein
MSITPSSLSFRNSSSTSHGLITKVPEIIVFFWITKIATTAMGETTSDALNNLFGPVIAVPLMLIGLVWTLRRQFRADHYDAWTYWAVVVMVAIFGTSAADALHVVGGVPYLEVTVLYAVILAAIFVAWHRAEGTLSIHTIYNKRREVYYWVTVLATFALGTATGDLTATTLHLGYFASGLLYIGLIAIPAIAYRWFGMNEVLAFWIAYVLTRPLGASFADWMAVEPSRGGLGIGTGGASLILAALVLLAVGRLARTRIDVRVSDPAGVVVPVPPPAEA